MSARELLDAFGVTDEELAEFDRTGIVPERLRTSHTIDHRQVTGSAGRSEATGLWSKQRREVWS